MFDINLSLSNLIETFQSMFDLYSDSVMDEFLIALFLLSILILGIKNAISLVR
jgi:hypothetical protein